MFAKNKVSQSMIDAVNEVTKLDEASPIKEPTSTGMRVYGRNYGNSAKAKQDQTKHELDKVKGPKDKEMKETAKPDFLDMDKDGNKKEPMKKAITDKGVAEELKGDQHKIDANHNNKIDGQDFKILKGQKKVKESFTARLNEKWKAMKEKKDVVLPEGAYKTMATDKEEDNRLKTPKKNTDIADKSYLKDKPGVKSDLKNLGRFLTGKKETNEEVELDEDNNKKVPNLPIDNKGIDKHYGGSVVKMGAAAKAAGFSDARIRKTGLDYLNRKEEVELTEEQLDEMINEVLGKDASAGDWIHDFVHSDNPKFAGKSKAERKKMALGAYYGKQNEATIAGTSGWKEMKKDVKDKSGAVHTPMSRAKDLARSAFKKVQDRTKLDK